MCQRLRTDLEIQRNRSLAWHTSGWYRRVRNLEQTWKFSATACWLDTPAVKTDFGLCQRPRTDIKIQRNRLLAWHTSGWDRLRMWKVSARPCCLWCLKKNKEKANNKQRKNTKNLKTKLLHNYRIIALIIFTIEYNSYISISLQHYTNHNNIAL